MKVTKCMGLDLSLTSSAFALYCGDVEDIERGFIKSSKRGVHRLQELRDKFVTILDRTNPDIVSIEGYAMGKGGKNFGRVFDIAEWGGIVRLVLLDRGIPTILIPPKTLKMYITQSGNAKKEQMSKALLERYGVVENQNDKADAIGASIVAHTFFTGRIDGLTPKEKQAIDGCQQIVWAKKTRRVRVRK